MDSHLYVSKQCRYSAQLIKFLHEKGGEFASELKVLWVDDYRREMLPRYVDRVPTLVYKGKLYQDKQLADFFYARPPPPEVEGFKNSFSDVGTPLEGPECSDTWTDFMSFRIECPPDDKPDNREFNLDQLQQARLADVPQSDSIRT